MTIGIYCLRFEGTDKVYIGQSVNIERRFTDHLRLLRNSRASLKLQTAYSEFGSPSLELLVECSIKELDATEKEAIEIFDSVSNGFNTLEDAGSFYNASGPIHHNAKYTKEQIEKSFMEILRKDTSLESISKMFGVPRTLLSGIINGSKYIWLKEIYPTEYSIITTPGFWNLSTSHSAKSLGIEYPKVLSPKGEVFNVSEIKSFANKHNLDPSALGKLLRGTRKIHKGWRICQPEQK